MKTRTFSTKALALVLTALLSAPSLLTAQYSEPVLPDPGSPKAVSKQQQEQIGLQAVGEVYKQFPVLPDSDPLSRYVQRLGRKMVGVIPQQYTWPYQFHVIPQKEINAFALPGGPIFINVGTIQAADNEAQLAGVMAHEMSHVYMQHSAKAMPKQAVAQIFAGVLGALLPGSAIGNLARAGIQIGAGTILMKYSRSDEAQADAVGAIIAYRSGYDPRALAQFFQKLEKQSGSGGPQFLSDHPNPGNRYQAISQEVRNWPSKSYVADAEGFGSAKQEALRTRVYTAQQIADGAKQGVWAQQNQRNGAFPANQSRSSNDNNPAPGPMENVSFKQIQPSSTLTRWQQNGVAFSYPENWQAQNGQGGVVFAPSGGVSGGNIAYGVQLGQAQDANAQSLDDATQNLLQSLQQSNPGMRADGNTDRIRVNGLEGRSTYLRGASPIQQNGEPLPERDWLVTVAGPQGGLTYLIFVSPETDFSRLRPTYEKMLNSLQLR